MVSRESEFSDVPVHTWRDQDLNENDHSCDSARDCSVRYVSIPTTDHCHLSIEALQSSNKYYRANCKLAFQGHLKAEYLHLSVETMQLWMVYRHTRGIGMTIRTRSTATSVIVYVRSILKVSTHSCLSVAREPQLASMCLPQAAAIVTKKATIHKTMTPIVIQLIMLKLRPRNIRR